MNRPAKPEIIRMTSRNIVIYFTVIGALIGYVVLHPLTMIIYQFELNPESGSFLNMLGTVFNRIFRSFDLGMLGMGMVFSTIGGLGGFATGSCLKSLEHKRSLISIRERIMHEDIRSLVKAGENESVEFKQSLRWDYALQRVNKELGLAIVKTMAGFLNGEGGTLLIGISDTGTVAGIEKDYTTLKHPDRDGFEQYIMQLTALHCGTDICPFIHLFFHSLDGHDVARVYLEPAPHPVYVSHENHSLLYLRTGNGTRSLGVEEALNYATFHWKT
jgi:hypothetical protein